VYALKAKLAIDEDRLYMRWLHEREHIKEDRYKHNFKEYLECFRPKPVDPLQKEKDKARIDKKVQAIEAKLTKGG